tara:strand:- start:110 stop:625 length:516 start_codon:yes stop_codon:yes gene_type:complete
MNAIVVDNFFNNYNNIKDYFKKIPLYDLEAYNKKFKQKQTWPGQRSPDILKYNPCLYNLILKEFFDKFNIGVNHILMDAFIHLRLEKDEIHDWIHQDSARGHTHTLMVYLSETNLNSGTILYNDEHQPTTTVNFVQNRAFLFKSELWHSSLNNHGNNIEDGRLTLNCFLKL